MKFADKSRNFKATLGMKMMIMCLLLLLIPSLIVSVTSYQAAVGSLNEGGEKRLRNNVKSTLALIAMLDVQIKAGAVGLEGGQEFVRTTMLGPKDENGQRPINKDIDLGENGYPFVINEDGIAIVHPFSEGANMTGFQNDKGELVYDLNTGLPVVEAIIKVANEGGGYVIYDFMLPGSDVYAPKVIYAEKDPAWGWVVTAGTYLQDFNQGAKQIINTSVITIIVMAIIGLTAIILFTRYLTRPIKQVSAFASEVAQGNLVIDEVKHKSKDEIGQLAVSFNEMVVQLKSLVTEVGRSVDQVAATSEELMASGEQTSQASEHISVTIQQVAEGAERQASGAEQGYQVVHDMSASVQQIASSTIQVSDAAKRTSHQAMEGSMALQQAASRMESIQASFNSLSGAVQGLGERSKEIVQMVQMITDIAAQTNLLALNASIEAARAGEHGRGFAVVAGEVRKLAEQTNGTSSQIAAIVQAIGSETEHVVLTMQEAGHVVSQGITAVEEAGTMFHTIRDDVTGVANDIDEVSQAASGIAAGTEQVMATIREVANIAVEGASGTQSVSAAAEEQTASMEEIAAASSMLAKMAEELQDQISKFKV